MSSPTPTDEADDWRDERRVKNSFQTDYGTEMADDDEHHGKQMLDGVRREATRGNPSDLGWGIGGLVLLVGCLGAGLIQMGVDGTIAFFIIVVAAIFIGNYATAKNRKGYGAVPEELIREWLWTKRKIRAR